MHIQQADTGFRVSETGPEEFSQCLPCCCQQHTGVVSRFTQGHHCTAAVLWRLPEETGSCKHMDSWGHRRLRPQFFGGAARRNAKRFHQPANVTHRRAKTARAHDLLFGGPDCLPIRYTTPRPALWLSWPEQRRTYHAAPEYPHRPDQRRSVCPAPAVWGPTVGPHPTL